MLRKRCVISPRLLSYVWPRKINWNSQRGTEKGLSENQSEFDCWLTCKGSQTTLRRTSHPQRKLPRTRLPARIDQPLSSIPQAALANLKGQFIARRVSFTPTKHSVRKCCG